MKDENTAMSDILKRRVFNIHQGVTQIPYFKNLPAKSKMWMKDGSCVAFDITPNLL